MPSGVLAGEQMLGMTMALAVRLGKRKLFGVLASVSSITDTSLTAFLAKDDEQKPQRVGNQPIPSNVLKSALIRASFQDGAINQHGHVINGLCVQTNGIVAVPDSSAMIAGQQREDGQRRAQELWYRRLGPRERMTRHSGLCVVLIVTVNNSGHHV